MKSISILFALLSIGLFASNTTADTRVVTQWQPYIEWSELNSSWPGNPFDLEAEVTFVHTDTNEKIITQMFFDDTDGTDKWKWRFTGTIAGEWTYTSSSPDDPTLDNLSGTVNVTAQNVNGFYQRMVGDKWGWQGTEQAIIPNYVMMKTDPEAWDTDAEIDALISEFIDGHGFTGFHIPEQAAYWFDKNANGQRFINNPHLNFTTTNPDPASFAALEKLISKTHAAGGAVHIWAWGDQERTQTLTSVPANNTGGANGVVDKRLQRYIAARLGPIPGWSMGYGFDLHEWTTPQLLTEWANYLNSLLGWDHFLGARGELNEIIDSQISENMDYTAYEQHPDQFEFDDYITTMQDRAGKPSFSEDRFRIRNSNRSKDLAEDGTDTRTLMWELAMAGGIAGIWANLWGNADNEVSFAYPNKAQLKTFGTFWHENQYFRSDLIANQSLSNNSNTRILVNETKMNWVLYRRDSDTIQIDLSDAPSPLKAVAVDTKKVYTEIDLGVLSSLSQTIALPSNSDWAIYLQPNTIAPDNPKLTLNKIATPQRVSAASEAISYSFYVVNSGNVSLSNISLADPMLTDLDCANIVSLGVGMSQMFSCTGNTYVVQAVDIENNGGGDGDIDNTATVTGNSIAGVASDTDSEHVTIELDDELDSSELCIPIKTKNDKFSIVCL